MFLGTTCSIIKNLRSAASPFQRIGIGLDAQSQTTSSCRQSDAVIIVVQSRLSRGREIAQESAKPQLQLRSQVDLGSILSVQCSSSKMSLLSFLPSFDQHTKGLVTSRATGVTAMVRSASRVGMADKKYDSSHWSSLRQPSGCRPLLVSSRASRT
jgi:hypothetical protein